MANETRVSNCAELGGKENCLTCAVAATDIREQKLQQLQFRRRGNERSAVCYFFFVRFICSRSFESDGEELVDDLAEAACTIRCLSFGRLINNNTHQRLTSLGKLSNWLHSRANGRGAFVALKFQSVTYANSLGIIERPSRSQIAPRSTIR